MQSQLHRALGFGLAENAVAVARVSLANRAPARAAGLDAGVQGRDLAALDRAARTIGPANRIGRPFMAAPAEVGDGLVSAVGVR